MPINAPQPPEVAVDAVRRSMARRSEARPTPEETRAGADSVSAPQRVFTVGLDALAGPDSIEAGARATGWRFLVEENREPVAAAEVQDQVAAAAPAELTEGPFVHSTVEALRAAEALEPVQDADFELRLLRVPALNLLALWLYTTDGDDLFMPLEPAPQPFESRRSYPEPEFAGMVTALAQQALDAERQAERPGELGG
jgi:hypothetical protein